MPSLVTSWISRFFKCPDKSSFEKLEKIESDILNLESLRNTSIDSEKRFAFRLMLYSFIFFGITVVTVYYYCWPTTHTGRVIFWTSVLIYPSVVSALKWSFRTFFLRTVTKADGRLRALREEKQRLLEVVMDTETFNNAQQILKRFDPLMFARLTALEHQTTQTSGMNSKTADTRSIARARNMRAAFGDKESTGTPFQTVGSKDPGTCIATVQNQSSQAPPRLLRPILPRERSFVERMLDALIGDGPDKRYALICNNCAAHNGMALQEEFEFLAFRCCYCSHFNPPRRTRLKPLTPSNVRSAATLHSASSSNEHLASEPTSPECTPTPDGSAKQLESSLLSISHDSLTDLGDSNDLQSTSMVMSESQF